jgi:predicted lysophospholipase L1 biosynthesis ABC-type transport system permease subunit
VVVSYRYWERYLGLEPEAVGRTIFVNGHAVTIAGVAPRAFLGIQPRGAPDLYLPIAFTEQLGPRWYRMHDGDHAWVQIMARIRPGGLVRAHCGAVGGMGVMAYSVVRRTNEIGIRMAMGVGRAHVQSMVLRESLWIVAAGLAAGIPAALALTRLIRQALSGIEPNDPLGFVAAGALMVVVVILAAWIPARRAARVDPIQALRCE